MEAGGGGGAHNDVDASELEGRGSLSASVWRSDGASSEGRDGKRVRKPWRANRLRRRGRKSAGEERAGAAAPFALDSSELETRITVDPRHPTCCSHLIAPCAARLLCAALALQRQHDCFFPAQPVQCPPPRNRVRGHGLLTSPITTATLPPPPQAHEFPARPAGSVRQRFAHIHRDSEPPLRCCAAV